MAVIWRKMSELTRSEKLLAALEAVHRLEAEIEAAHRCTDRPSNGMLDVEVEEYRWTLRSAGALLRSLRFKARRTRQLLESANPELAETVAAKIQAGKQLEDGNFIMPDL